MNPKIWEVFEDRNVRSATQYIAPDFTIKVTRRHRLRRNDRQEEFVVTVGKPNYLARKFIKACIKAKEPFPVKKIQLKFWPKKRK